MAGLTCFQFPYGSDNYGVLLHDSDTGQTACVDAGDADAALQALKDNGWSLTHLFITHHHADHTAGLEAIKAATGCKVIGPEPLSKLIAGLDVQVKDRSEFEFAERRVRVIHTPGHTTDMMNYYIDEDALVFTGDTLFSMGCGRLFEGDAAMMLDSINKLKVLPGKTMVYCAHEYSATNAQFALDVEPSNAALIERAQQVSELRKAGQATVPTLMSLELKTNPFLRTDKPELLKALNMNSAAEVDVFAELRERRNGY